MKLSDKNGSPHNLCTIKFNTQNLNFLMKKTECLRNFYSKGCFAVKTTTILPRSRFLQAIHNFIRFLTKMKKK